MAKHLLSTLLECLKYIILIQIWFLGAIQVDTSVEMLVLFQALSDKKYLFIFLKYNNCREGSYVWRRLLLTKSNYRLRFLLICRVKFPFGLQSYYSCLLLMIIWKGVIHLVLMGFLFWVVAKLFQLNVTLYLNKDLYLFVLGWAPCLPEWDWGRDKPVNPGMSPNYSLLASSHQNSSIR
jgi:hypothetical protein